MSRTQGKRVFVVGVGMTKVLHDVMFVQWSRYELTQKCGRVHFRSAVCGMRMHDDLLSWL